MYDESIKERRVSRQDEVRQERRGKESESNHRYKSIINHLPGRVVPREVQDRSRVCNRGARCASVGRPQGATDV